MKKVKSNTQWSKLAFQDLRKTIASKTTVEEIHIRQINIIQTYNEDDRWVQKQALNRPN